MKLGQIMSMQSHILSPEVLSELANLQMRAPAMHPTLARAQFRASFGKFPEEVFQEFAAEPLAAASLGQVHRALTKNGQQVAVKIQYPAIRYAIEDDFKLLRSAAFPVRVTGHATDLSTDRILTMSFVSGEPLPGFLADTKPCQEMRNRIGVQLLELFSLRGGKTSKICVFPVRRWTLSMHRERICDDGSLSGAGHCFRELRTEHGRESGARAKTNGHLAP